MLKNEKINLEVLLSDIQYLSETEADIDFFCTDENAKKEIKRRFKSIINNGEYTNKLKDVIVKNSEFIDVNKLILVMYRNYRDSLRYVEENKAKVARVNGVSLRQMDMQQVVKKKCLKELSEHLKGMNTIYTYAFNNSGKFETRVIDTKKETNQIGKRRPRNEKTLKEINKLLGDKEVQGKGLVYLFQFIEEKDLDEFVFNFSGFESQVTYAASQNADLDKNDDIKNLTLIAEQFEKVIDYADLDSLFLIATYRAEQKLKNNKISNEAIEIVENIVKKISNLVQKGKEIEGEAFKDENSYEKEHIKYSFDDLKKFTKKFYINEQGKTEYLSDDDALEIKNKLLNGNIQAKDIDMGKLIQIGMNKEEVFSLMSASNSNFEYIAEKLNLEPAMIQAALINIKKCDTELLIRLFSKNMINNETVKKLYLYDVLNKNDINELMQKFKISDLVKDEELLEEYEKSQKENLETGEEDKKIKKLIDLYICIKAKNNTEQEKQKLKESFFENNIEKLLESEGSIEYFFKNGLVSKEKMVEWCGKEILSDLPLEELRTLFLEGKIEQKDIENKAILEIMLDPEVDYETKKQYILDGVFSRINIVRFYKKMIIYPKDFDEFYEKGLVGKFEYEAAKKERNKDDLEKSSKMPLGELEAIPAEKFYVKKCGISKEPAIKSRKKNVILPSERVKLFKTLGAKYIGVKKGQDDKNSAFYDYNFYALNLDKSEELKLNTIIIAERIYQDKKEKTGIAVDNATYLFTYEDYLVNCNLNKQDMLRERKNIIYRVHHTQKWGISLIEKILQIAKNEKEENIDSNSKKIEWGKIIKGLSPYYAKSEVPGYGYDDSDIIDILNHAADIFKRKIQLRL